VQTAAVVIVERGEETVEFDQENSHAGKETAERLLQYCQYTDASTILSFLLIDAHARPEEFQQYLQAWALDMKSNLEPFDKLGRCWQWFITEDVKARVVPTSSMWLLPELDEALGGC